MIGWIKSRSGDLFIPQERMPTVIQCSTHQSINAIVGRLMLLKYFVGKGHPVQLSMNMAGFYVRDSESFLLEVKYPLNGEGWETISYKMEIRAIPPEGFDARETVKIKQNGNLVETIEKTWEAAYLRRGQNERLYPIGSHDISVVSLLKDRCLSLRKLGEFVEKWFFYIPAPRSPLLSFEPFSYEIVADITPWLHALLRQEPSRSTILKHLSVVQPLTNIYETDNGIGVSSSGGELIHPQDLNYVAGVVAALLSDSTSFVVLVRPERFVPAESEKEFLEMVREAKGDKDVLILTESQTMPRHLPVFHQMAEDKYGWVLL